MATAPTWIWLARDAAMRPGAARQDREDIDAVMGWRALLHRHAVGPRIGVIRHRPRRIAASQEPLATKTDGAEVPAQPIGPWGPPAVRADQKKP